MRAGPNRTVLDTFRPTSQSAEKGNRGTELRRVTSITSPLPAYRDITSQASHQPEQHLINVSMQPLTRTPENRCHVCSIKHLNSSCYQNTRQCQCLPSQPAKHLQLLSTTHTTTFL